MARKKEKPGWTCIAEREFDGDIVITDPCYIKENGERIDWDSHESRIKDVGLCNRTYYGDWGCTVFRTREDSKVGFIGSECEEIGNFCADAGMVCVLDMRDARRMSSDIDKWIEEHDWCATIIKGFKGSVKLMTLTTTRWRNAGWMSEETKKNLGIKGKRMYYDDVELRVRGDGVKDEKPFSFESYQTSL